MAKHSPRFLKIAEDAKRNVKETNVADVKARLDNGEKLTLVDVREDFPDDVPQDHPEEPRTPHARSTAP